MGKLITSVSILAFILIASVQAADVCVGPSATGDGLGGDWNNIKAITGTPTRGDTWFLQDGAYSNQTFTTANSGSTLITIKKAIETDHGSATGWSSAYGDGQAVFGGTVRFRTSYWTLDGQTGGGPENSWTNNFGIRINVTSGTSGAGLFYDTNNSTDFTAKHIEIWGNLGASPSSPANHAISGQYTIYNTYFGYIASHDMGGCHWRFSPMGMTNEFVWTGNFQSGASHSETASMWRTTIVPNTTPCTDIVFRFCNFNHVDSTGGLIMDVDGFEIYGCTFNELWPSGAQAPNGVIGTWSNGSWKNGKIYNNTFYDFSDLTTPPFLIYSTGFSTGTVSTNNLFYKSKVANYSSTHDYSYFSDSVDTPASESNSQITTGDPTVDGNAGNFQLLSATDAGQTLPAPYNTDALGNVRGADGVWDRGAYEYASGGADTTEPVISSLSSNTPSPSSATITWTTDELATSGVQYGLTAGYGSEVTNSLLVLSHSVVLPSLSASTEYHFAAYSSDGSGNSTNTADFTFTTAAADTTPPTVAITYPTDLQVVSNTVTVLVDASDGVGVASVDFYFDDVLIYSDTATPYSSSLATRSYENGAYTLAAVATDTSSNLATNSISVTISNTALSGPIVYFAFNEDTGTTSTDSISGNVLTFQNGATWGIGYADAAVDFDGVNQYATAPNSVSLDITNTISISAWVNLQSTSDYQQIIAKVKAEGSFTSPYFSWHLYTHHVDANNFSPSIQITDIADNRFNLNADTSVPYGQWALITGVYDGAYLRIYINGIQIDSVPVNGTMVSYAQPVYVGAHGLPDEYASGLIDELKIWDRALTDAEVLELASTAHTANTREMRVGSIIAAP